MWFYIYIIAVMLSLSLIQFMVWFSYYTHLARIRRPQIMLEVEIQVGLGGEVCHAIYHPDWIILDLTVDIESHADGMDRR